MRGVIEMKLNLLVIRSAQLHRLKSQYELLGLTFNYHRHGKGPMHYSANLNGLIFEIYPLKKLQKAADNNIRLGFEIQDIDDLFQRLALKSKTEWKIISGPKITEWGKVAIIEDFEGRKIEIKETC